MSHPVGKRELKSLGATSQDTGDAENPPKVKTQEAREKHEESTTQSPKDSSSTGAFSVDGLVLA